MHFKSHFCLLEPVITEDHQVKFVDYAVAGGFRDVAIGVPVVVAGPASPCGGEDGKVFKVHNAGHQTPETAPGCRVRIAVLCTARVLIIEEKRLCLS